MKSYHGLDIATKVKIYKFAMELRRRGLGATWIRKIIQEKFGILIGEATIKTWSYRGVAPVKGAARKILIDGIDLKLDNVKSYEELSLEERMKLYEGAVRLASMGYKPSSIATALKLKHGVKISRGAVYGWIHRNSRPRRTNMRPPINLMSGRELAVIAANSISDGSVTKERRPRFSTQMKDREPVELIIECLEKVTGFRYKPQYCPSAGAYYVASARRILCEYLRNEDNLLRLLRRFPREFIKMFFEAEGGPAGFIAIRSYKVGRPRITAFFNAVISVYNTNIKLLEEIQDKLRSFRIRSSISMKAKAGEINIIDGREVSYSKPCYRLMITHKDSIIRYGEEIGFISIRKQEKLNDIINILEKHGKTKGGAMEWIRRYEYREGGRERWVKRESTLPREEAISELTRLLRERLKGQ